MMAIGDYIICETCDTKLVYVGRDREARAWLMERFGTEDLICPKCLAAERDARSNQNPTKESQA